VPRKSVAASNKMAAKTRPEALPGLAGQWRPRWSASTRRFVLFASLKQSSELPLAVAADCDQCLHDRLTLLEAQLATVNRMAAAHDLPDAIITESREKIQRRSHSCASFGRPHRLKRLMPSLPDNRAS
jgi:hypothetical protein